MHLKQKPTLNKFMNSKYINFGLMILYLCRTNLLLHALIIMTNVITSLTNSNDTMS